MIKATLKKIINWALDSDPMENMWASQAKANKIKHPFSDNPPSTNALDNTERMHLIIHRATGGYAIEFRQYDARKDESYSKIHVASETDDLGEVLSKIIVIENLRR